MGWVLNIFPSNVQWYREYISCCQKVYAAMVWSDWMIKYHLPFFFDSSSTWQVL